MAHRGISLALLVLAFTSAVTYNGLVTAGDKKSSAPITKPGEYKLYDGKVEVKVTEDTGKLDYEVKFVVADGSHATGSKGTSTIKKGNAVWAWAIYAESNSKVWISGATG
jgi:hypothetical protein